jgi:hypothetical protein
VFVGRRSRIQQVIVEVGDISSGFSNLLRWRSAVENAAIWSTVAATRYSSPMRARTQISYMVGSTYRPLDIC